MQTPDEILKSTFREKLEKSACFRSGESVAYFPDEFERELEKHKSDKNGTYIIIEHQAKNKNDPDFIIIAHDQEGKSVSIPGYITTKGYKIIGKDTVVENINLSECVKNALKEDGFRNIDPAGAVNYETEKSRRGTELFFSFHKKSENEKSSFLMEAPQAKPKAVAPSETEMSIMQKLDKMCRCPYTGDYMKDPVLLKNGVSCNRPALYQSYGIDEDMVFCQDDLKMKELIQTYFKLNKELSDQEKDSGFISENLHEEILDVTKCPLTLDTMDHPSATSDGHTYEKESIETYIRGKKDAGAATIESPFRTKLLDTTIVPHLAAKKFNEEILPKFQVKIKPSMAP